MSRVILRFGAVFLTFTIGLAINFLINGVVGRWIETPEPVLEEPCASLLVEPQRPPEVLQNCGLLVVSIEDDRSLTLNGKEMGILNNTSKLVATLNEVFAQRTEARVYKSGFEMLSDIPEEERIEKTVLIRAPRWSPYGEVSDLIEVISATGARPIGLQSAGLRVHTIQVRTAGFTSSLGRTR